MTLDYAEYLIERDFIEENGKPISAENFKNCNMYKGLSVFPGKYYAIKEIGTENYYSVFGSFIKSYDTACVFPSKYVADDTLSGLRARHSEYIKEAGTDYEVVCIVPPYIEDEEEDEDDD